MIFNELSRRIKFLESNLSKTHKMTKIPSENSLSENLESIKKPNFFSLVILDQVLHH